MVRRPKSKTKKSLSPSTTKANKTTSPAPIPATKSINYPSPLLPLHILGIGVPSLPPPNDCPPRKQSPSVASKKKWSRRNNNNTMHHRHLPNNLANPIIIWCLGYLAPSALNATQQSWQKAIISTHLMRKLAVGT